MSMQIIELVMAYILYLIIHGYGIKANHNAGASSTKKLRWLCSFFSSWIPKEFEVEYDGHIIIGSYLYLAEMYIQPLITL